MQVNVYGFLYGMFILLALAAPIEMQAYVQARVWGRLGNHFFIIAAATSLALENDDEPIFPDFTLEGDQESWIHTNYHLPSLRLNHEKIFPYVDVSAPAVKPELIYQEPSFTYTPISYHPNMLLEGWFQSEKYFYKHKREIVELFAPSDEIVQYLEERYADIIHHPNTVSVHLRCYKKENPNHEKVYPTYGREYFEKAMGLFSEDAWFIVFSDQIAWAKEQLAEIPRKMIFIEGEPYYHDFYLMSFCQHQIICNSSFSWWAAYLNKNPNKKVIVPPVWFCPEYNHDERDLIPDEWVIINGKGTISVDN